MRLGEIPPPGSLDPIEIASRDEITSLQTKRLGTALKHAYEKVPVYWEKFEAAGVHPGDFKKLEDLRKFPFTSKADLRENYPFGLFAVPREKIARIHASSGTTGKPTVVGYTKADLDVWATLMARSMRASGARPGMLVHIAYGYGLFTGGLGAHAGAEKLGCGVVPMSGGMTERQVPCRRHILNLGLLVDEPPDVPRTRQAIDLGTFTCDPLQRDLRSLAGAVNGMTLL